jgi:hypothetical protein
MSTLAAAVHELIGLFVEDGSLALQIVAVVLIAGASAALVPEVPLATGAIICFGCLGVLFANVARAARR